VKIKFILLFIFLVLFSSVSVYTEEKPSTPLKSHTGTILVTQETGPYMYLLLDVEGRELWISTIAKFLPADITVGDKVEYAGGLLIQGFKTIIKPETGNDLKIAE
jgi:hypothetical protein